MTEKISSAIIGAAAEHYVMYRLLLNGMIAALAPKGVPDADIIVSDKIGSALSAVQVKGRRDIGRDGGWHMKAKHEKISRPLLYYCFVDFGKSLSDPARSWIIPSSVVAEVLATTHKTWLATPGRNGRAHVDHEMRRLIPDYGHDTLPQYRSGWLDQYFERWDLIASCQLVREV